MLHAHYKKHIGLQNCSWSRNSVLLTIASLELLAIRYNSSVINSKLFYLYKLLVVQHCSHSEYKVYFTFQLICLSTIAIVSMHFR